MREKAREALGVVAFLLFPWLIYGWVSLTGTTCSIRRYGRREPIRVATAEDLSESFEVALLITGLVLVTVPIALYLRRRERRRRPKA